MKPLTDLQIIRSLEKDIEIAKERILFWNRNQLTQFDRDRLELWIDLLARIEPKLTELKRNTK